MAGEGVAVADADGISRLRDTSPRHLEIYGEVEGLLTGLFLPKYAAVLEAELLSLLADAMAQNLGAIEHRFKLEAAKRRRQCEGDRQP